MPPIAAMSNFGGDWLGNSGMTPSRTQTLSLRHVDHDHVGRAQVERPLLVVADLGDSSSELE